MTIAQETLDGWRAFAEQVRTATFTVRHAYARGQTRKAQDALQALHDTAIVAGLSLEDEGAQTPPSLPAAPAVPLHLLDTPTNRRYRTALQQAHEAALAVDAERFGSVADGPAAGALERMITDVELEIFGPEGRGDGIQE